MVRELKAHSVGRGWDNGSDQAMVCCRYRERSLFVGYGERSDIWAAQNIDLDFFPDLTERGAATALYCIIIEFEYCSGRGNPDHTTLRYPALKS